MLERPSQASVCFLGHIPYNLGSGSAMADQGLGRRFDRLLEPDGPIYMAGTT